jgi:glucose-1-phosphate thymidylyltransferase
MSTTQAVILARGLGTRMRRELAASVTGERLNASPPKGTALALAKQQAAAAANGAKGMMPFARPFLDYSLSVLADAGIREAVLVVGPEHDEMRSYFKRTAAGRRVTLRFAVQDEPRGTADALAAAANSVDDAAFLVLNSDNLYPLAAVQALAALGSSGLVAFEAGALARGGIEPERVFKFALLDISPEEQLRTIVEKPAPDHPLAMRQEHWVSMNLWSFTPRIFNACTRIAPSSRGELELQDAVTFAMQEFGEPFHIIRSHEPVLDLSSRADIAVVGAHLAALHPQP